MTTIQFRDCARNYQEVRSISIDASDTGLPPGRWPMEVAVQNGDITLTFRRDNDLSDYLENGFVTYWSKRGLWKLTIYND